MSEPLYAEPELDPDDYDEIDAIAAIAAPIFALHGWKWDGMIPDAPRIAQTIRRLYDRHRAEPLNSAGTGRFVLVDDNPHNGVPVLYEGIRVFLNLGELPPLRGDEILTEDRPQAVAP